MTKHPNVCSNRYNILISQCCQLSTLLPGWYDAFSRKEKCSKFCGNLISPKGVNEFSCCFFFFFFFFSFFSAGERSFHFAAPAVWNSLPNSSLRNMHSLPQFKSNLQLIFFFILFWIHRCHLFVFNVCAPWVLLTIVRLIRTLHYYHFIIVYYILLYFAQHFTQIQSLTIIVCVNQKSLFYIGGRGNSL